MSRFPRRGSLPRRIGALSRDFVSVLARAGMMPQGSRRLLRDASGRSRVVVSRSWSNAALQWDISSVSRGNDAISRKIVPMFRCE